jgi:hypothetical protein
MRIWLAVLLLIAASLVHGAEEAKQPLVKPEVDGRRAYDYLTEICKIGTRVSGTAGMARQQQMMVQHFSDLDADISFQSFDVAHPATGEPVRMKNMIVSWHPEAKERILLCCHYDTRPFPDRDPRDPRGVFVGANDGASGVALYMEMANHIKKLDLPYGVDMVFFDGEELVYNRGDKYFLGSEHFAKEYRDNPPEHRYICGVLVDMIADRQLQLYYEKNSVKHAPEVARSVWKAAAELKQRAFVSRERHEVLDDHIPLNEIAKIPTCDLIDFDYAYWHTTSDVPRNCSPRSLESVGNVLLYWLQNPLEK